VKFDTDGHWLLTAGFDGIVCLWNVHTFTLSEKFRCHSGMSEVTRHSCRKSELATTEPCLDVEWLDSHTFASGSADKRVHIWNISSRSSPLVIFE
jgi:WD40 repeat protein